jgi:hypothetical protein
MTPATNAIVSSLPRAKQGVASAVNDTARELGAAFGIAILGSAFNIGYRHEIDGRDLPGTVAEQAREAPAIAVRLAERAPNGGALLDAARDAFIVGMRYALLVGVGLLLVGAVFVWVRGASRVEQQVEDELDDFDEELPQVA